MSLLLSPFSKISVGPYSTTVTTATSVLSPTSIMSPDLLSPAYVTSITPVIPLYNVEVDTGLNDNYMAQQQIVEHYMAQVYNKWLYGKDMCYVLKYMKVVDGKVRFLSSIDEYKKNKICDDTEADVETKIDFINDNILTKSDMRKLLNRLIVELGYKWYELPQKEDLVFEVIERHIKKALKSGIGSYTKQ